MNRERFPGLADGWARLDGPAGTQMLDTAIDAMAGWMRSGKSANNGGLFAAGVATDELTARTRAVVGELLGGDPGGVTLGPSMTALTLRFTQALRLQPGDEIVCSRLDHDANVAPWLQAAERAGASVVFADPVGETLALPAAAVAEKLTERTRWVAVTAASNAVGSIPDLPGVVEAAHAAGARVFVDAVHHVPHRRVDVAALGCDALACSPYKWFGPHAGVLWARPELLAELQPAKLRPSSDANPERWEVGTPPYESWAGIVAAAEYLLGLDWDAVRAHEDALLTRLLDGLDALPGVIAYGRAPERTPTLMFTVDGVDPAAVAQALADASVAVWHGNYYALELHRHLGLEGHGGAVRAGIAHYNDAEDVDRLLEAVAPLTSR